MTSQRPARGVELLHAHRLPAGPYADLLMTDEAPDDLGWGIVHTGRCATPGLAPRDPGFLAPFTGVQPCYACVDLPQARCWARATGLLADLEELAHTLAWLHAADPAGLTAADTAGYLHRYLAVAAQLAETDPCTRGTGEGVFVAAATALRARAGDDPALRAVASHLTREGRAARARFTALVASRPVTRMLTAADPGLDTRPASVLLREVPAALLAVPEEDDRLVPEALKVELSVAGHHRRDVAWTGEYGLLARLADPVLPAPYGAGVSDETVAAAMLAWTPPTRRSSRTSAQARSDSLARLADLVRVAHTPVPA